MVINMNDKIVRVGVATIAFNDKGQYLMGRRRNTHGQGTWAVPGGTLEFSETIEACAAREMLEETGLVYTNIKIAAIASHFFAHEDKHFVAIYCLGRITGEPQVMEPDKIDSWQFFDDWNDMPLPVFVPYQDDVNSKLINEYLKQLG